MVTTLNRGTDAARAGGGRLWDLVSRHGLIALLGVYLLLPQLFSFDRAGFPWLGLARVHSGDEPHYLVQLNSILDDGDLELSNNYAAVHTGGHQAGRRLAGSALNHHSIWYAEGQRRQWGQFYSTKGSGIPALRENVPDPRPHAEYPWNLPGLPILLSMFVFPFKGTPWLEPSVLFLSYSFTFGAALMFRGVMSFLFEDRRACDLVVVAAFLGTPLWHYSRALFPESYLGFFVVGGFYFFFKGSPLLSGLMFSWAFYLKPPIILTAAPLMAFALWKDRAAFLGMAVPLAAVVLIFVSMNSILYGGGANTPVGFGYVNPLNTIGRVLFSNKGLISFSPVVLLCLWGWGGHLRRLWGFFKRRVFSSRLGPAPQGERSRSRGTPDLWLALILCGWLFYFGFVMSINKWDGGFCFGPRYLTPLYPLIFVGLMEFVDSANLTKRAVFLVLFSISLLINALGALPYWAYWSKYPLTEVVKELL